jgi:hypothetical protein
MRDLDQELKGFLLGPERAVDQQFIEGMRQAVLFEQRVRAAQLLAWKKFSAEVLASAGVVAALLVLTELPMSASAAAHVPFGPAALGLLLVGIWIAVTLTPETNSG